MHGDWTLGGKLTSVSKYITLGQGAAQTLAPPMKEVGDEHFLLLFKS
jgi:hypothetical protein